MDDAMDDTMDDSTDERVTRWLDAAAVAPHNGLNPQLELPDGLVEDAAPAWKAAIRAGGARSHDAAAAFSKHRRPTQTRAFWREQLESSDAIVRQWAVLNLADLHVAEDLGPVLTAFARHDDLAHPVAVRARDWQDRNAIPALVELLSHDESVVAENAALSLSMLPGVPTLEAIPDPTHVPEHRPEGYWTAATTSLAAPYRQWWVDAGRSEAAAECAWWNRQLAGARTVCN